MNLPNFTGKDLLALDIETLDPDLLDLGPGPRRPGGKILGVGVADGTRSVYVPVAHPATENVELSQVIAWLNELNPKAWVGANLLYDLDWLCHHGMKIGDSKLYDVQLAEPLLNENRRYYNLDSLATAYLGLGKGDDKIQEYCERQGWKGKPQQHLAKMPADIVGPYCQQDCEVTFDVLKAQLPLLAREDLTELFELECRLLPLLLHMRSVGVRFNVSKLNATRITYEARVDDLRQEITGLVGEEVNVQAPRSVKEAFDRLGIPYQYTDKGNPSFSEAALSQVSHPVAQKILEQRHYQTILGTFLNGLGRHVVNGRIHCQFHPLRGDQYGTVSGRFSSSNPNLQNQPGEGEAKHDIRGLFLPEVGHAWLKLDYSQIELRVLAHYARGPGADKVRQMYVDNPHTDFHQACADMIGIDRRPAKNINFGVVYGMGVAKMATMLGLPHDQAAVLISGYHQKLPFLKQTSREAMRVAEGRGYIKTLLKRRRRFPDKRWCYKALNALIQGSAADVMKKAMVDAWDAGVFNVLVPHLTVHDELDCSVPSTSAGMEAVQELKKICENAIPLRVPLVAECELSPTWAGKET